MLKNLVLVVSITILLALSCSKTAHNYAFDVTQNKTNELTASSKQLLEHIDAPVTITIFSPSMDVLNHFETTLERYKQHSAHIAISLQQTVLDTKHAAKLKVDGEHVLHVNYKETQQAVEIKHEQMPEAQISNLIQHVINNSNNWIAFLAGHQEADPLDTAEFGLSAFAQLFIKQGMHIATLNLATQQFIPQNTALVIVANPQQDFLVTEKALLHQYIANGGKLLWFTEPDAPISALLAEEFGIKPAKGVAIDPDSVQLGSPHPALKILTTYPQHAITQGINSATILPWSGHLQILYEANDWQQDVFLKTAVNTWTYNGPATKDLAHLSKFKEFSGPLNIGIALTKPSADGKTEQRATVIADSSFMINKYLPLYANAQLAANIVAWTQDNKHLFIYNTPPLKDLSYLPSKVDRFIQQYVFTLFLPLFLVAVGMYQNRKYRYSLQQQEQ